MKKKLKTILALAGLTALCLGAAACAKETKIEEYQKQGYKISVTYDANGGSFLNRDGVTIVDMFRPSDYRADDAGTIHIRLTEPTNPSRPTSGSEPITLTKPHYFFAGWYQTRTLVENEAGKAVDANGAELEETEDGSYVYADGERATPVYTYSGHWDFAADTLDYAESDGTVSLTLYAGWVPYYEFHYYYQKDGEWTYLDKTSFDYKTTNAPGSKTSDKDTIWLPVWEEGAMQYTHLYADNSPYTFPKIAGTTFSKAYLDEACTREIENSFEHQGGLDLERGAAVDRVQNIYIVVEEGEKYKITKPEQLVKNANLSGVYEILADLDFTGLTWPTQFATGVFTGKMFGSEGHTYRLQNISAVYSATEKKSGGLFGEISGKARMENLSFENVTFDLSYAGTRQRDMSFGLFAGRIEEGARISGVGVTDGTFRIGPVTLGPGYSIHLVANGSLDGITAGPIRLQIYGKDLIYYYNYTIQPDSVAVDGDGNVSLTFVTSYRSEQPVYDIKQTEVE